MAFDLTPGFNLGISNLWSGYKTAKKSTPSSNLSAPLGSSGMMSDRYGNDVNSGMMTNQQGQWVRASNTPSTPTYGGGGGNVNNANQAALDEAAKTKKMWESLYMNGLSSYEDMIQGINNSRVAISRQLTNIKDQYSNQKKALGQQLEGTLQDQGGYFSGISPEAYQSQQGVYANKAQTAYNEGLGESTRAYDSNRAEQARALAQNNANKKSANAYKTALETFRAEGGIGEEPKRPSFKTISPKYENVDLSGYADKFANLSLANTLNGMSPEQNKINIKKKMNDEGIDPDLQDFLYQDLFPEDYTNDYYPTASEYQALNM
jgi:hypothetical protein